MSDNFLRVTEAAATTRMSADERRESIIEAALAEFAHTGFHGTSTDAIAARAGISQPYLFRLFGTKKELFLAAVERGFGRTLDTFRTAAEGVPPEHVFAAMARAYGDLIRDREMLLAQMQAYVACEDAEIRDVVRRGYGDIYRFVARVSGASAQELRQFFAMGMLCNVVVAMDLPSLEEDWARELLPPVV